MRLIQPTETPNTVSWIIPQIPFGKPSWMDGPVAGFDVESTGINPQTCGLVSAAFVIDYPAGERESYEWLVQTDRIELEATSVHGISNDHAMKYGRELPDVLTAITAHLDWARLVGIPVAVTNGVFDWTIIDRECHRAFGHGLNLSGLKILDTLVLDRLFDPYRAGRRTLTATLAAYGEPLIGAHQALQDCAATIRLAKAMARKFWQLACADLDGLQDVQCQAYRQWAEGYRDYRHRYGDRDFGILTYWPLIPYSWNGVQHDSIK